MIKELEANITLSHYRVVSKSARAEWVKCIWRMIQNLIALVGLHHSGNFYFFFFMRLSSFS